MQGEGIFAAGVALHAGTLAEGDIAGREGHRHAQLAGQRLGYHLVAGARHAGIGFRQQQHVGVAEIGMGAEEFELRRELAAALDVPGHHPVALPRGRRAAAEVGDVGGRERLLHQRGEVAVHRVGEQFALGAARGQQIQARHNPAAHRRIHVGRGLVQGIGFDGHGTSLRHPIQFCSSATISLAMARA